MDSRTVIFFKFFIFVGFLSCLLIFLFCSMWWTKLAAPRLLSIRSFTPNVAY